MRSTVAALLFLSLCMTPLAIGQDAPRSTRVEVDSKPTRVTAYRGRAWVERTVTQAMQPGLYKLVFSNLPLQWDSTSVQARVSGSAKVLGIDTMTRQVATPPANLEQLVEAVEKAGQAVQSAKDAISVRDASIEFVRVMMTKAADDDRDKAGTGELDIAAVEKQMEFFSGQMSSLLNARLGEAEALKDRQRELEVARSKLNKAGGATRTQREAIVELAVAEDGDVEVTLGYLVSSANWSPRYDVRGDLDAGTVAVEYGAQVFQQSGEDWTDVTLVLSTAQPSQSANPPTINPVYVDVHVPPPPREVGRKLDYRTRGGGAPASSTGMEMELIAEDSLDSMYFYSQDAQVQGGGSSVTFTLPRRMTVETDSESAQRTRIAEFDADVDFTFVAMPVLTEQVYLRGRFENASEYQMLPGQAGIFMGGDYVGPTALGSTAPGAKIELFFGADPSIQATRTMLTKNTGNTGVFSDWVKTSYEFVLKVDNGSSRPAKMELWDRRPMSRSEEIEVSVLDLSMPLSTEARYVADSLPQGLLRWDIQVPPHRTGDDAYPVSYDLEIERKKGVEMTPLPD